MQEPETHTDFAPARRSTREALERQRSKTEESGLFTGIVAAMPDLLLVLNGDRQIVYANKPALDFLGVGELEGLLGLRPGEAVKCVNSGCPGGCGTSEKCSTCGAVLAILASQRGEQSSQECRILAAGRNGVDALDLKVTAAPMTVEGEFFTAFYVSDISGEKRRKALERIFFHDVLNTAGALEGLSGILTEEEDPAAMRSHVGAINRISQRLVEEIVAQRELLQAENGELRPAPAPVQARAFLARVIETYRLHDLAKNKSIRLLPGPEFTFAADATILSRVIGNMLKNALEASEPGETVSVGGAAEGGRAVFSVNNPAVMPKEIKLQVFNRSFSTKGAGRGLGTYSIKLLGERYLKGETGFTSEPGEGTTFTIKLPLA